MNKKVAANIGEICDVMESNSLEIRHYLDLETGEVVMVSDYEEDTSKIIEKIDEEPDLYKPIPKISSDEAYRHMENFIYTVKDEKLKNELSRAINRKGAFRRFKDVLSENPEEQIKWYDFKDRVIKQKAKKWLEQFGIPCLSAGRKVEEKNTSDNWVEEEIKKKKELIEQSINMFVELVSRVKSVIEIVLFGSLATGKKRIAKDIDLMLFVENTDCVDRLALSHHKVLGKFHASPDVFVFNKDRNFIGNICHRKECPSQSVDCQVTGCGKIKYIEKRPDFTFNERNIFKNKPKVLWLNPQYEVSISEGWFDQIWGK